MMTKFKANILLAMILGFSFVSHSTYADSAKRASIASRLFKLNSYYTYYNYNYYGQRPVYSGCTGYLYGHSGLDMQTTDKSTNAPFYALASGQVIAVGTSTSFNKIAVYNSSMNKTVVYLHASRVGVYPGQNVSAGSFLGYQGSTGAGTAVHVHLEVRSGKTTSPGCGATGTNINPELVF